MSRWSARRRITFVVGLAAAYLACCQFWPRANWAPVPLRPAQHPRLLLFLAGILVWEILPFCKDRLQRTFDLMAAIAAAAAILVYPVLGANLWGTGLLFVTFFAAGVSCLGRPDCWLAPWLSWNALRYLRNMSYSFYLLYGAMLHAVDLALRSAGVAITAPRVWVLLPVSFAVSWAGATVLFLLVESPSRSSGVPPRARPLRS